MACVVKRRGKYVLDYDQNGKRRWETTNANKKEAALLIAQRVQEVARGAVRPRMGRRRPAGRHDPVRRAHREGSYYEAKRETSRRTAPVGTDLLLD